MTDFEPAEKYLNEFSGALHVRLRLPKNFIATQRVRTKPQRRPWPLRPRCVSQIPDKLKWCMVDQMLNLRLIDDAFGPSSDLYRDVLGVKANASPEQIQRAYLSRRNDLFTLLEQGMNGSAEREMDAVVLAMRILGDPSLRNHYDDLRNERMQQVVAPQVPTRLSPKRSRQQPNRKSKQGGSARVVSPDERVRSSRREYREELSDVEDTTHAESMLDVTDDGTHVSEEGSTISEGTLTIARKGFAFRVKDEVMGAIEDTTTSFAQVLNVFTLQEADIRAVRHRIDKAKKQMVNSL